MTQTWRRRLWPFWRLQILSQADDRRLCYSDCPRFNWISTTVESCNSSNIRNISICLTWIITDWQSEQLLIIIAVMDSSKSCVIFKRLISQKPLQQLSPCTNMKWWRAHIFFSLVKIWHLLPTMLLDRPQLMLPGATSLKAVWLAHVISSSDSQSSGYIKIQAVNQFLLCFLWSHKRLETTSFTYAMWRKLPVKHLSGSEITQKTNGLKNTGDKNSQ